jgi:DNA-binding winged helix-turn-helix (wHTH) protein
MLTRNGTSVKLGSRAFDLLTKLATSGGKIVSKSDLVDYVWPSTFVDDSNLRFQMTSLRKALGDARDLIKTIPGRGYLFADTCRSQRGAAAGRSGLAVSSDGSSARLSDPASPLQTLTQENGTRFTVLILEGDGSLRDLLGDVLQSLDRDAHPPGEAAGMRCEYS